MSSTRITRRVNAPRASVYRALLDARAVQTWMVPTGMTLGWRMALAKLAALVERG